MDRIWKLRLFEITCFVSVLFAVQCFFSAQENGCVTWEQCLLLNVWALAAKPQNFDFTFLHSPKKGTKAITQDDPFLKVPKECILVPKRFILVPKVYILVPKLYILEPFEGYCPSVFVSFYVWFLKEIRIKYIILHPPLHKQFVSIDICTISRNACIVQSNRKAVTLPWPWALSPAESIRCVNDSFSLCPFSFQNVPAFDATTVILEIQTVQLCVCLRGEVSQIRSLSYVPQILEAL